MKPIIMKRMSDASQSLLQRFFAVAGEAQFAVVMLSADDFGVSRAQYELPTVADKALKFRARQNVILELGFFFGKLTWDRVVVPSEKPDKLWPDSELPSDLNGMVTVRMDNGRTWKNELRKKLIQAGFILPNVGL